MEFSLLSSVEFPSTSVLFNDVWFKLVEVAFVEMVVLLSKNVVFVDVIFFGVIPVLLRVALRVVSVPFLNLI